MITIQPTETEFVHIKHEDWGLAWRIWLPECIYAGGQEIKPVSRIHPDWVRHGENHWSYEYDINEETEFRQHGKGSVDHFRWRAEIQVEQADVHLKLELTNTSGSMLPLVVCDGGCLQAMNDEFADECDFNRAFIFSGNEAVRLNQVHRGKSIRSIYHSETCPQGICGFPVNSEDPGFFGYSDFRTQSPVIIGSTSLDQQKAIAIGYANSHAATQNGDGHHCLHSRPFFGDLEPLKTVSRTGIICFGDKIQDCMQRVHDVVAPVSA